MTALTKPVSRKTGATVARYGKDAQRRIVVTLRPGPCGDDMIELRPERTRRGETMLLSDVWAMMLRAKAGQAWREKMEARKAAKKQAQAARHARAATRKLAREVNAG